MKRVCRPGQLPGAEIGLPALLVQVRKEQKEQAGHEAWQNRGADKNAVHCLTDTKSVLSVCAGKRHLLCFHRLSSKTKNLSILVTPFDATDPSLLSSLTLLGLPLNIQVGYQRNVLAIDSSC